jgi:hypothetical protein
MAEQRTYQGHVYTRDAPGQPWTLAGPAAPAGGMILRDPTIARTQQRQDNADTRESERLQMERERLRMSQSTAAQEAQARALQIQKARVDLDQSGGDGGLDPASVTFNAQQVLAGAPMPAMGMGKQGTANRQAVMNEVARLAGAKGMTGADLARQIAHYNAGKKQISNLENMAGTIGVNEQTALANGQQYVDRSAELPGQTSIAPLNALSNAIQRMFGGTTISKADAAYNTFTNEYAKVVAGSPSGAGTLSDSARHEAMSTINGSGSVEQKQAAFEQMKADMANRMVAIHGGINNAYKALTAPPGYEVPVSTQGLTAEQQRRDPNQAPVFGGAGSGSTPGNGGGGGPANPYGYDPNQPQGDPRGTLTASTAQFVNQDDPKVRGIVDKMIRAGKSAPEINAALQPYGYPGVQDADVRAAQDYLRKNPGYTGGFAQAMKPVEQTAQERAGNALGQVGAGAIGAYDGLNALTFGKLGEASDYLTGKPGQSELAAQAAGQAHPLAKGVGEVLGTLPAFVGAEAGLGRLAARGIGGSKVAAALASPITADVASGAYIGAGSSPDNRLGGAVSGALAGGIGGTVGRKAVAPLLAAAARTGPGQSVAQALGKVGNVASNAVRGAKGEAPIPFSPAVAPAKPSVAEALLYRTADKAGIDDINGQLSRAQDLGVPMSLADTNRGLTSLAGAAVRRSPSADQLAQDTLIPRSRGQISRYSDALERDLGPAANVPQISQDLQQSAGANAKPLYEQAYAAGQVNDPQINQILQHPELKAAFDDAQQLHRNDAALAVARGERPPEPLTQAYTLDPTHPDGFRLTTPPDVRTIDYIKRGLDARISSAYNGGDAQAKLSAPFLKNARQLLLARTDEAVPAFAQARAAYAGPMQADEALLAGQNAAKPNVTANQLGVDLSNASDADKPFQQLGYRGGMLDNATKASYSRNPFDATLGSPDAEQKLALMYADKPQSVAQLLAQRDMERGLASTTNDILGNSKTAQRQIADEAFAASPVVEGALHAGAALATHGASVPGTAARFAGIGMRSRVADLLMRNSVQKADAVAPLLLNTDPQASAAILRNIVDSSEAYRNFVRAQQDRLGGPAGVIGAGTGYAVGG